MINLSCGFFLATYIIILDLTQFILFWLNYLNSYYTFIHAISHSVLQIPHQAHFAFHFCLAAIFDCFKIAIFRNA